MSTSLQVELLKGGQQATWQITEHELRCSSCAHRPQQGESNSVFLIVSHCEVK